jgi:hypothetical protein
VADATKKRRSQLLGSGGFSPRFPSIPPAIGNPGLPTAEAVFIDPKRRVRNQMPFSAGKTTKCFFEKKQRLVLIHKLRESSSTLPARPIRIGVYLVGLLAYGSPESKLPSQRASASGLPASFLTAYSGGGRAGFAPASLLKQNHKVSLFIREEAQSSKDAARGVWVDVDRSGRR